MQDKLEEICKKASLELHPESPVPRYYQLSRFLEKLIQDEAFQTGDRFPSEEAIANYFHVSRPTANKAVQSLIKEGFLSRDKGLGTFVKEKPFVTLTFLAEGLSFADQFPSDVPIKSKIIWCRTVPATPKVAKALAIEEGAPTVSMRRLRYAYDHPIMVCESQLAEEKFPGIKECNFIQDGLYKTLEMKYNCPIVSSDRYAYSGEVIDQEIMKLLNVQPFSSILIITGISYTTNDEPVDYLKTYLCQGVVLKSKVRGHDL
jgi:GntR family transcriptional regulator